MYRELLKWYITLNYQLVAVSVRSRDRSIIPIYAREIAFKRYMDDYIILTSQLAADEFEDAYEILEDQPPEHRDSLKDIAHSRIMHALWNSQVFKYKTYNHNFLLKSSD